MRGLTWESLPEFNWCDLYAQVAWGLNDPEWEGYSKKDKNRLKKQRIAEARAEVEKYEHRHNLPIGSLLGGEGAGAAPSALSAGGQPAGLVVDAAWSRRRRRPRSPRRRPTTWRCSRRPSRSSHSASRPRSRLPSSEGCRPS